MQISLKASPTASPHLAPLAVTPTPWASGATSAATAFGQWLHGAEAKQVQISPPLKAAAPPAAQPGKSLLLALPRPVPAPVGRGLNSNVGAHANLIGSCNAAPPRPRSSAPSDPASPAPASASTGKDDGPPTTVDTATDPSTLAGPAVPPAVPLTTPPAPATVWGWAPPRTGSNAAGDVPANDGGDNSSGLQTVARAINGSPADGGDTLPVDSAGAGRLVFSAGRRVTPGLSLTAWRAGSAAADGDTPIPARAGSMAAPAGLPIGKAQADAIGLALAAASARQTDAQAGTASTDTTLAAAGLGERHPAAQADTVAATTLPDAIAIATPGAGPLATLAKAAALHEVRIATALTDPGFAPALGATLTLLARDGVEQARLNLHPAEMGPITVRIMLDGAAARVEFLADVAATRAALEAALPALASALQEAGLSLSGGGVFQPSADNQGDTQGGPQSSQSQAGGSGQDGQNQPRRTTLLNPAAGSGAEPRHSIDKSPRGIVDLVA